MMAQKSFEPEESNVSEAESISEGMEIKEFGGEIRSLCKNNSKNSVINTFLHHCLLFYLAFCGPIMTPTRSTYCLISFVNPKLTVFPYKLSCTDGGNVNWCSHCGEQHGSSLKNKSRATIWSSGLPRWL